MALPYEDEILALRRRTGAGLALVREAIEATGGDVDAAEERIRDAQVDDIGRRTGLDHEEAVTLLVAFGGDVEAAVAAAGQASPEERARWQREASRHAGPGDAPTEGSVAFSRKVWRQATAGLWFVVIGLVVQLPTVTADLRCARETGAVPSCRLRWSILLDVLPVRDREIRELRGVAEGSRATTPVRSDHGEGETVSIHLATDAGTVWMNVLGHPANARPALDRIERFVADPDASALELTLPPAGPFAWIRGVGVGIVLFGLLYWIPLPFQLARRLALGDGAAA